MDFKNIFVYLLGLASSYAYDDLSLQKVATQSSTWVGSSYYANNAVDGNIYTCMRTYEIGGNSEYKTVWWKVDLGAVYGIYSVTILFKNYDGYEIRQRGRFAGFSLYVSNTGDILGSTLCYKDGPELPPLNFTSMCTEHGRYVIFYNERQDGRVYPTGYAIVNVFTELCEVIIQGCKKSGVYGKNCETPCPTNCKDDTCHIQNGTCFGCKPGWTSFYCNIECVSGWYGNNCSQQCGHCRDNTACNHVTGQCEKGCAAGWTGKLCEKVCVDGTYGYSCINNCSGHCLNDSRCNKQTGHCDMGCDPGYTDRNCSQDCSSGYFGLDCRERCSGHCINDERCDHVSGFCPRGCMDGYIGRHCNISCEPGYYGTNCSLACPPNCKTCRYPDGLCSCKAGWMGHDCSIECSHSYGENCKYSCSGQCINRTCDRFNGNCWCDGKYDSLRNVETTDVASSTFWIVAFFISLLINIIVISATLVEEKHS